jgi:hypothetical protein
MPLNVDPIQQILQAFSQGLQVKQQREVLGQRQKEHTDRMTQEEADRKEKIRQFTESQKLQKELSDRNFSLQKAQEELQRSKAKIDVISRVGKGELPGQYTSMEEAAPMGGVPGTKKDLNSAGIDIGANEWQSPDDAYANNPSAKLQKDLMGMRQLFEQGMQENLFKQQDKTREDVQGHQKELFGLESVLKRDLNKMDNDTAMARVNAMANRADATANRQSGTIERMNRTHADKLISEFNNAESTKIARKILPDFERMTSYIKDPKKLSSINDIDLVYMAARNFDPGSTVREGEFNAINKNVNNWLEGVGLSVKNATDIKNGKSALSPAARVRLMRALAPRIQDNLRMYSEFEGSIRNRIEGIAPGYSMYMPDYISAAMGRKSKSLPESVEVDDEVFNTYKPKGGK